MSQQATATKKQYRAQRIDNTKKNGSYFLLIDKSNEQARECTCKDRVYRGRKSGKACKHMIAWNNEHKQERKQAPKPAAPVVVGITTPVEDVMAEANKAMSNVIDEAVKVVAEHIERIESDMYAMAGATKMVSSSDYDLCEGCQCRIKKGQKWCPNC